MSNTKKSAYPEQNVTINDRPEDASSLICEVIDNTNRREEFEETKEQSPHTNTLVGKIIAFDESDSGNLPMVRWVNNDRQVVEKVLSFVHGLELNIGDQILILKPVNWEEWIVTAVLTSENASQSSEKEIQLEQLFIDDLPCVTMDDIRRQIGGRKNNPSHLCGTGRN